MFLIEPKTEAELEEYFEFRWKYLRSPLGMPRGSERDGLEDVSYHLTARCEDGELIAAAKFKPISKEVAQIAQVAVAEELRQQGIGSKLVEHLESKAKARGFKEILIVARDYNVEFFSKLGYQLGKKEESPRTGLMVVEMSKRLLNIVNRDKRQCKNP